MALMPLIRARFKQRIASSILKTMGQVVAQFSRIWLPSIQSPTYSDSTVAQPLLPPPIETFPVEPIAN